MKKLTTPQAILFGFGLIALAIVSVPYSSQIVKPAHAELYKSDVRKLTSAMDDIGTAIEGISACRN